MEIYYYPISALINAITSTIVGYLAVSRNPKSPLNRSFGYFAFSVAFWAYSYFIWQMSKNPETALFWCRALMAGAIFIPSAFLHFCVTLIDQRKRYLKIVIFWYLASTVFLILDFFPIFVKDVRPRIIFPYWPTAGIAYAPFLAMFIGVTIYAHVLLFRAYRKLSGFKRNQIKYVFLGTAIGFAGGSTNYPLWYDINILPIGNALVAIYVITVAYSIIKYRLMEIKLYVTRATVFISVTISIILIALGITSLGRELSKQRLGENWIYVPLLFSMLLAAIGYAFSIYIIRKMDEKRLRQFRDAQDALEISGRGMIEIDNVKRLAKIIPRYLTMFYYSKLRIKISHATIFVLDSSKSQYILESSAGKERYVKGNALLLNNPLCDWFIDKRRLILNKKIAKSQDINVLRIDDIDYWMGNDRLLSIQNNMYGFLKELRREMENLKAIICVPSFFKGNLIGFLLLGSKSEGIYTEEELDLFSQLATNAAAAFRSAQLSEMIRKFEEEKAEIEKLKATGELLGSVRHEMGNFLAKISGNAQVMFDAYKRGHPEKIEDYEKKIVGDAFKAKAVLKYVDEYKEKSASDKIDFYNLNELIQRALSHSNDMIEKWNIRVSQTIDPRITLKGKETLPDIFKHLIINSCYGMELEGGELSFNARIIKETNTVEVVQTDTGEDLTKEIIEEKTMGGELFAERGKLGGLNLFIARRIVKDHGGSFDLKSNDGKGTKFIVQLPLDFTKVIG